MSHQKVFKQYEEWLKEHGDTPEGVGWTKGTETRFDTALDIITSPGSVLDLGCGTGHMLTYAKRTGRQITSYTGIDVNEAALTLAKQKHPDAVFLRGDILTDDLPVCDYAILNGVFTYKGAMTFDEMWGFLTAMTSKAFKSSTRGIAFNVQSTAVDWQQDRLFHCPVGPLTDFVTTLSRRYVIRHDYGLYEYFVYLLKSS